MNPDNYTAESYAALLEAVEAVEAILNEGGYTQETIDEANAMLAEAMANLVLAAVGGAVVIRKKDE